MSSNVIKYKPTLKAVAKKYHLSFCSIHGYYEGNAYKNDKGENLPQYFVANNRVFELKYFDGCFNPFLVECNVKDLVFDRQTHEPVFKNYPNPKWDTSKFYTK